MDILSAGECSGLGSSRIAAQEPSAGFPSYPSVFRQPVHQLMVAFVHALADLSA